jgi:uncharacterized repeat protein (TIGR03803 family)
MSRNKSILFTAAALLLLVLTAPAFAAVTEKILYSFCAAQLCPDGSNPQTSLVSDPAGNLYGAAVYGGNSNCVYGCGTVFKLRPVNGTWKYIVLHHFENNGEDGYYPAASVILDGSGNVYGTTALGGTHNAGTVFELLRAPGNKWKRKTLYDFGATPTDGYEPLAPVVFDAAGNLYGTTFYGGSNDEGIAFSLTPAKKGPWTKHLLHTFEFNGKDGFASRAGLIFDAAGNLYGTTVLGGLHGNGTVFELLSGQNDSWKETVLYSFKGEDDGSLPNSALVMDKTGSLYSTTVAGGSRGIGNVFQLSPDENGWTLTNLYSFTDPSGAYPEGGVIFDAAGNLYGTTDQGGAYNSPACGGSGCGTVFKLTPGADGSWTENVVHSFGNGSDGSNPYAGLIMDPSGRLYGVTTTGGNRGFGTVFKLRP